MDMQYEDLEQRFGETRALDFLMEIERHVRLNSALLASVEPNSRLQVAMALMQETRPCVVPVAQYA